MQAPSSASPLPTPQTSASTLLAHFLPTATLAHKMDRKTPSPTLQKAISNSQPDLVSTIPYSLPTSSKSNSDLATGIIKEVVDQHNVKNMADGDDDGIEYATSSRRQLRTRVPNKSLKALENVEVGRRRSGITKREPRTSSATSTPRASKRVEIRKDISNHTVALRTAFFIEKKDLLLPLLPPNNHVRKLIEKHERLSEDERSKLHHGTPYEEIEEAPRGILAIMKPYQLSGLSFLVYLHRNGLSGILGDEMGLGKTLQTISLIQYLKEHDPKAGRGTLQRPFLVVCPLSVLSSWMAELKRWAPHLKAVRFHGPIKERDQIKKVVMGDEDIYGNATAQGKAKQKRRKPQVISLDSDSEDEETTGVDVVVTTYDCFKAEQSWFKRALVWRYVVLDEGHTVKNHESLVSKSLQGLQAEYRLLLTGTPLQNNLSELWALFHWLYPEVFNEQTLELFEKSFNLTKGHYSNTVVVDSRRLLELIMLRRMKDSAGVNLNLPPKTEVLLFVPLSPTQRAWYQRIITKSDEGLLDEIFKTKGEDIGEEEEDAKKTRALEILGDDSKIGTIEWTDAQQVLAAGIDSEKPALFGKKNDYQRLMNLLMQLRKVCNHPYQIPDAQPDPYRSGSHVIHTSGKFIVLEKLLNELVVKQKKKILIFSGFVQTLDLVDELLLLCGGDGSEYRSVRIDGSVPRARRNLGIRLFNSSDTNYRVMLISTRAGGLGINLASASDVVLLDQDWNPQITLQAEARAHRIGQKNPVTIYKLVSSGTVEEQMMGRIQKKLYLSVKVTEAMQDIHTKFGSGKKSKKGNSLEQEEDLPHLSTGQLMNMVRRGAATLARPQIDVNEMLDWDWDMTLSKCKDRPVDLDVKKDVVADANVGEEEEVKWLTEQERVESHVFEGKHLNRSFKSEPETIASQYAQIDRSERRKGKNTTVMVDGFAISKESMGCKDWEAVPTYAGTNAAYAEPKRAKKVPIIPQSHCQVCLDGGQLVCCQSCPRSFHLNCLDKQARTKALGFQFNCPQHECFHCLQKTTDAGGMLYRCRWCERAYCEDHLEFDETELIDDNLPEYEILGYPSRDNAFYVRCPACRTHFIERPGDKKLCDDMAHSISLEHERRFKNSSTPSTPMTNATTLESTAVNTPSLDDETGWRLNNKGAIKEEYTDGSFRPNFAPLTAQPASIAQNWPALNSQKDGTPNRKQQKPSSSAHLSFTYDSSRSGSNHPHAQYLSQTNGPALFQPKTFPPRVDPASLASASHHKATNIAARDTNTSSPYFASHHGHMSSNQKASPPSMANRVIIDLLDDSDGDDVIEVASVKKRKISPELSSHPSSSSNKRQIPSAYYGQQ
ncbi:putative global transcription activator [Lachnellula subtilissima]|uniref:Putative global transcription activator n=1 Tax=Lachnellula subtilissima TaxID=602034 RepID=A0A8H8U627_9HELO|nr:putative global transcription activator [Lachnellula subtilissima]